MRLLGNDEPPLAVSTDDFGKAMPWIEVDDPQTITAYLRVAQEVIEVASRRPLTERQVEIEFECCDPNALQRWWFPVAPVKSVDAVTIVNSGNVADSQLDQAALGLLRLYREFDEPQLSFENVDLASTAKFVRVAATVGYAEGKAPEGLKHAIILLVKEWYDAGLSIGELSEDSVSFNVKALIRQKRYQRPGVLG